MSLVLGYGPALLLVTLAGAAWLVSPPLGPVLAVAGRLWAGAILIFLGGVRRGLSFFTAGGPRPVQIATTMWLFFAGLAGLVAPPLPALVLIAIAFASVALLDPRAADRGEVPAHFARLRPPQMAIFLAGTLALLGRVLMMHGLG